MSLAIISWTEWETEIILTTILHVRTKSPQDHRVIIRLVQVSRHLLLGVLEQNFERSSSLSCHSCLWERRKLLLGEDQQHKKRQNCSQCDVFTTSEQETLRVLIWNVVPFLNKHLDERGLQVWGLAGQWWSQRCSFHNLVGTTDILDFLE